MQPAAAPEEEELLDDEVAPLDEEAAPLDDDEVAPLLELLVDVVVGVLGVFSPSDEQPTHTATAMSGRPR